ncbi:plasmid recombination protein, partial [Enterococcus faecalis]
MSMIVARMQKMKTGNLGGIQKHNQREFVNHSNKDIDVERSEANYDLANEEPVNYQNHVSEIIDSQRESTRAIRKDAVLVNEWIITSDQEFFKDLSESDTRLFFQESFNFYADIFGKQNMAYAVVHMDETTPHMHLGVVPMINGKLSSKSVFNRKTLLEIQEELPKYLKEKGFDIERGMERSERKNLSVSTYKSVVNQAKKEAEKEVAEIKRQQKTEKQQLNQEFKKLNALKGKTENAKVAQKWL